MLFDVSYYVESKQGNVIERVSSKNKEDAIEFASENIRNRFGPKTGMIFQSAYKVKPTELKEGLDKAHEIDELAYLDSWEPGLSDEEVRDRLPPSLRASAFGYKSFDAMSKETGIPLHKLEGLDLVDKKLMACSNCKATTYYNKSIEGKTCPLCRIGVWVKQ